MTTFQCSDYPLRSLLVDGVRHNALVISTRKGVIRRDGSVTELEFFQVLVDKKLTYMAFKPEDFVTYCQVLKRGMGVSEKDLARVDRNGDCFLIASSCYYKLTRNWKEVNTGGLES